MHIADWSLYDWQIVIVIDDEFYTLGFVLRCFHCVYELRNAFSVAEESLHYLWDIHRVEGVKARIELNEMVDEFEGRDIGVESVRALELLVPCFFNNGHDEVSAGNIGRLVELTVISSCFWFSFCLMNFCSCGVLVNCVIV